MTNDKGRLPSIIRPSSFAKQTRSFDESRWRLLALLVNYGLFLGRVEPPLRAIERIFGRLQDVD
jgi:hypothetical protein